MSKCTGLLILTSIFALVSACVLTYWIPGSSLWAVLLDAVWLGPIGFLGFRIFRLSSVAWCVKIYSDRIEGYDYARRKTVVAWNEMQVVDFARQHIVISGHGGRDIRIAQEIDGYSELGRTLLDYSFRLDVPVAVDGMNWSAIEVQSHFPFLTPAPRPDPE